ncbi:Hypothetical predicted protein, partial [Pelobates cultripes]
KLYPREQLQKSSKVALHSLTLTTSLPSNISAMLEMSAGQGHLVVMQGDTIILEMDNIHYVCHYWTAHTVHPENNLIPFILLTTPNKHVHTHKPPSISC